MEIKLSERMKKIAELASGDGVVADIGTDHGYIPLWLISNGFCSEVILTDINQGPLDKAAANIQKYLPGRSLDMRLGSGLEVLKRGEADTVIIAGMGGDLIISLLERDEMMTLSIKKFILQPRRHADKLRKWIEANPSLEITGEYLAKEDRRLSEIILVENKDFISDEKMQQVISERNAADMLLSDIEETYPGIKYEISQLYFVNETEELDYFLRTKIFFENEIIDSIEKNGKNAASTQRKDECIRRISTFENMRKVRKNGKDK